MKKYIVLVLVALATTGCNLSYNNSSASQLLAINSFTASKSTISPGETVTLSWSVSHPKAVVSIDPGGFKNLPTTGSVQVSPSATTTYTLTAVQAKNKVTQGLVVTVSNTAFDRDTIRLADMKRVQSGLANYYTDKAGYPVYAAPIILANVTLSSIGWGPTPSGTTYVSSVGPNPTPGGCQYTYTAVSPYSYTVTFCLEGSIENLAAGSHTLTPAGFQ